MKTRLILALSLLLTNTFLHAKNELNLAWESNPRTIDPRYANDAYSQYLTDLTNCSLINFDPSGNKIGNLATSWEWKNPKTLIVTIRQDARFNDGTLVSTDDVMASYDFLSKGKPAQPSPLAAAFSKLKSIKALSSTKIEFELLDADVTFVDNLFIGILPKNLASGPMISDANKLKSCGPFVLSKVGINDYVLTRNEHYSLTSKAKLDQVTIRIVKDDTTRFSKLLKGEIDLVQNGISRDRLKSIPGSYPNLAVDSREGLNVSYIGFNFRDKYLSKKEVRQAISLAINREEVIQHMLQGMAEPASTFLSSGNPFRAETPRSKFDINEANALLDKAGFPRIGLSKMRFELTLKTTADVARVNISRALVGYFHKIGIKLKVEALEWGKFKSDVDKGQVQLWFLNWIGYKDPDIFRYVFATESFPPHGGNRGWYSNPQLDKILTEARMTHEMGKRKALYLQAQKIVQDDLPYAFLWHEKNFVVRNKDVKGFEVYADGRFSSLVNVTR